MSLLKSGWLLTNDNKIYNTDDLTGYRVEQERYNPVICASNKYTGERVYIDWLPAEYSFVSVEKLYPISEIIQYQSKGK